MSTPHRFRSLSAKLSELKGLIETARWSLLDAAVMVNELQNEALSQSGVTEPSDVLGEDPNHEDYVPGGEQG